MIEDGEYPNCTKMTGAFEMSVPTLKRDIEFMKDSLKMPIEFDVLKNGYYFTGSLPHFPRVPAGGKRRCRLADECQITTLWGCVMRET